MNSRNELVDLTLALLAETELAILVSDDGTEKKAVWVPRSQVEIERLKPSGSNEAIVTMPSWLAQSKGLI